MSYAAANLSHGRTRSLPAVRERLLQLGDLPDWPVSRQLDLLETVADSELGAFLLQHGGLDAYWTDVVVGYRPGDPDAGAGERLLLERLPAALATRERFALSTRLLQAALAPDVALGSLPCGTLSDLLALDYRHAPGAQLSGLDLDAAVLATARHRAARRGLPVELVQGCAWQTTLPGPLDVLSCHGLSIYEPDSTRLLDLYRRCAAPLKPGGLLITSFMTPPPGLPTPSPWRLQALQAEDLMLQQVLFSRLADVRYSAWRTHDETQALLREAGFAEIVFHEDRACMFPVVSARRC
ncbi:hypothetical protein BBB39_04370 [Bordetella trematum]|uniref:Methyltransferase domain n=1 Tax=Bordetella trematum TaxID=123899 RepID=A0A157SIE4_9BORD|nr:class I SAM-dependent methyltransferase [Bordetella trematum]AUL46330.1 hypothetical protein BTL55_04505 [Bordetella trematum]AZR93100.1 hypothetical protein BBB39_04370 [Bordetella trematum]NNH19354.1 class I SAM-dependent methyltransferase [Bordetella trematum]QIM71702.1 class I SAM-dependent methyltransferase [Bordetella trematum]SAI53645.1 Methyltransferase domain [Bordetella trematum]